ncbi:MAG: hypothetical protein BWX74_00872 [Tenericutes bacterium ADurb.Bin087]|nr:MAG: hypothetical protein BWX74_00872 [Tenericutes bacterium ADurb.Bin087]
MIDTLIDYFERGEIDKVIALSKGSNDPEIQFFYLAALRYLGEYEIALSYIADHQMHLYTFNAPQLIEWHIDILLELEDLDQALNVLKIYENFPYFSLETNELIAKLGDKVQQKRKEKTRQHNFDLYELERRLLCRNVDLAFSAINYMVTNFHEAYISLFKRALLDAPINNVKSLIILALKELKHNETLQVNKFGKLIKVNPATAPDPFKTKAGAKLVNNIKAIAEREDYNQFGEVATSFMNGHATYIYPFTYELKDVDTLTLAYRYYIYRALGRFKDVQEYCAEYDVDQASLVAIFAKYHFNYFD